MNEKNHPSIHHPTINKLFLCIKSDNMSSVIFNPRLPPRIKSLQVLDKWHVAYYATQIGKIRRILDAGDLPMPDTGHNRRQTKSNSNKENEVPRLVVSPTVMCVTCTTRISAFQ